MVKLIRLVILFFAFVFIYGFGVSRTVFGGDSGDIILSYFFGSFGHAPGYPLNTVIGYLLSRMLFLSGEFAFRANMVSAILMAATLASFFALIVKLTKQILISFITTLALAFVPLFWFYAHIAEVFQLNLLLVTISLLFLFKFWQDEKQKLRYLYLSVFFWGLSVFHHQTSLLLAPAYIFAFIKIFPKEKISFKTITFLFLSFLLGVLPYLLVFLPSASNNPAGWVDTHDPISVLRLITRADYGTFTAAPDLVGFSFIARLIQVYWFFRVIVHDFTLIGITLFLLGFLWLLFKKRDYFWFFLMAFVFTGPFFLFYASFPPIDSFQMGTSERFLLLNYLFIGIVLSFGVAFLLKFLASFLQTRVAFIKKKFLTTALFVLFLLFPIGLFQKNWFKTTLADNYIGGILANDVLNSAVPAGIIFVQGDTTAFNSLYAHFVQKDGPEAVVIMPGRLRRPAYRKTLTKFYPDLNVGSDFLSNSEDASKFFMQLVDLNFGELPIYILEDVPIKDDYQWVNEGLVFRLYKKDQKPRNAEVVSKIRRKMSLVGFSEKSYKNKYLHFFDEDIKKIYASFYIKAGFEMLQRTELSDAQRFFNESLLLNSESVLGSYGLGVTLLEQGNCNGSKEQFESILVLENDYVPAIDALAQVYDKCFGDKVKVEELKNKSLKIREKKYGVPVEKL